MNIANGYLSNRAFDDSIEAAWVSRLIFPQFPSRDKELRKILVLEIFQRLVTP